MHKAKLEQKDQFLRLFKEAPHLSVFAGGSGINVLVLGAMREARGYAMNTLRVSYRSRLVKFVCLPALVVFAAPGIGLVEHPLVRNDEGAGVASGLQKLENTNDR